MSTPIPDLVADLALAHAVADAADTITTGRFGAPDLRVESKPDLTPVSDADVCVEAIARDLLGAARPGDALLGEETGGEVVPVGRQWVIDPIDGTKNFVRGVPVWASLVALLCDGVPVVGVISAPALGGRRWWAAAGAGAYASVGAGPGRRLAVSGVGDLAEASLSFSSISGWARRRAALLDLTDAVGRVRGYGDFFSYCLLAEGALDLACEPEVSLWDLAALDVLVREAGGRFTDLDGRDGPHGGSAVATNGVLHEEVLTRLSR